MTDILTREQIDQRIAARRTDQATGSDGDATTVHGGAEEPDQSPSPLVGDPAPVYRHIRPPGETAETMMAVFQNPGGRWQFGIPKLDAMTRGVGNGEFMIVTGAPHGGKSQIALTGVMNNPEARVLIFTPDEVAELVLAKLLAMTFNRDSEELEMKIKAADPDTLRLVREAVSTIYRNLLVVDSSLTLVEMNEAIVEAREFWGGENADCVIVDYLELLPGEGGPQGVASKAQELKRWTKAADVPMICIHQAKTTLARGEPHGLEALRYAGAAEAIFVVEVFRKKDSEKASADERLANANTISFNVAKNKRPPCKTGQHDLFIDPKTGFVRESKAGDEHAHQATANTQLDEIQRQQSQRAALAGTQMGAF